MKNGIAVTDFHLSGYTKPLMEYLKILIVEYTECLELIAWDGNT